RHAMELARPGYLREEAERVGNVALDLAPLFLGQASSPDRQGRDLVGSEERLAVALDVAERAVGQVHEGAEALLLEDRRLGRPQAHTPGLHDLLAARPRGP